MLYPITVEVLHQVFSPHGFVEKIVTFQKSAGQLLQVFFLSFISIILKVSSQFNREVLTDFFFCLMDLFKFICFDDQCSKVPLKL